MRFGHCWDSGQLNSIKEDTISPPLPSPFNTLRSILSPQYSPPVPPCCHVAKIQNSEENQERACMFGLMRTSLYQRDVSQSMHLWSAATTMYPKHLGSISEKRERKRGENT